MGRYVSIAVEPAVYYGIRDIKPGYGSGAFRFFGVSGTFTVPSGVSEVRVTALGGGGNGGNVNRVSDCCWNLVGGGGGGGGYIVATVPVTAGCICNIAVGAAGGNSCFGVVVYACAGGAGSGCTAGTGGTSIACTGATCIVARTGNVGCTGFRSTNSSSLCCPGISCCCGQGGASGSPLGAPGTGPFPGSSGSDVYNCRGFNGENSAEADIASKFGNSIRWPGEAIIGTSRAASQIAGTAAGNPIGCYCVTSFGGGNVVCGCCFGGVADTVNAGYGGGGAGVRSVMACFVSSGYQSCDCAVSCACFRGTNGAAGSGFVVVEF